VTVRYSLDGKVCLITGSARGIGYATARELHGRGAYVVLTDLDEEAVTRAAKSIGERAMGFAADVTDSDAMEGVVSKSVESFDRLDVVIANAGVAPPGAAMRHVDPNLFERTVEIDLLGVWRSVRPALPQIVENRGHVVVISSVYAWVNGALASPYAASKAGVEALGRALRAELTPSGASASVAHFGFIDTEMVRQGFDTSDPLVERFAETFPAFMRKRLPPSEAAAGVVDGIEKRAPRIIVPRWWGVWFALRGIINPIMDRRMERQEQYLSIMRDADAAARPIGQEGLTTPATADDVAQRPQAR
jgi:NAD(P)-dependent dehydrogenase (short-subunit alcohol dehydrogenase family)